MIGDKSEHAIKKDSSKEDTDESKKLEKKLQVALRCEGNFVENVPLAMILVILAELNGAPTWVIHTGHAALFSARVSHVEFGLKSPGARGRGRQYGYLMTSTIITGFSMYNFVLGFDALKTSLSL